MPVWKSLVEVTGIPNRGMWNHAGETGKPNICKMLDVLMRLQGSSMGVGMGKHRRLFVYRL